MLEAPEPDTAWPPTDADLVWWLCPRCGSDEDHLVDHRRLKAFMPLSPFGADRLGRSGRCGETAAVTPASEDVTAPAGDPDYTSAWPS